jgi:hypothetical protein
MLLHAQHTFVDPKAVSLRAATLYSRTLSETKEPAMFRDGLVSLAAGCLGICPSDSSCAEKRKCIDDG